MSRWIEHVNLPKETGFYCARDRNHDWWNLVVYVHGDAPFFNVDVWKFTESRLFVAANIYDIEEFGPKLAKAMLPSIERSTKEWQEFYA